VCGHWWGWGCFKSESWWRVITKPSQATVPTAG
jgi:hypothetical protein